MLFKTHVNNLRTLFSKKKPDFMRLLTCDHLIKGIYVATIAAENTLLVGVQLSTLPE